MLFFSDRPFSIKKKGDRSAPGQIYHYLPPRPPQIHQAVFQCDSSEMMDFTDKPDFLRGLLQVTDAPADALIAATVRDIYRLRKGDLAWLVTVGRNLSSGLGRLF